MLRETGSYDFIDFTDINDADAKLIWMWRNNDSVRKWMYNSDLIPWESHLNFLDKLPSDKTKSFYLVRRRGKPIGVYSLVNIQNKSGEGGFYLAPELQESGLSVEFCYFTFDFLFNSTDVEKICGYALVENQNANSLNRLFGFSQAEVSKNIDGEERLFYYGELTKECWTEKVKKASKILRLVEFTLKNVN
jgi:UDP-4-amino-4,6-dideoxy-N-acetyl-beta-L-altrosamine N-acetyltransferase